MTTSTPAATQEGAPSASGGATGAPRRTPGAAASAAPAAPAPTGEPVEPATPDRPDAPDGPAAPVAPDGAPPDGVADRLNGAVPAPETPAAGRPSGSNRVRRIVLPVLLVLLIAGIAFGINYLDFGPFAAGVGRGGGPYTGEVCDVSAQWRRAPCRPHPLPSYRC
jgi:hypothetical protein